MSRWPSGLTRSQVIVKAGIVYEFSSGQGSLKMLEGIKLISPDRRLLPNPWGMHICDYQQKKDTRPVLRRGMPSAFHVKKKKIRHHACLRAKREGF